MLVCSTANKQATSYQRGNSGVGIHPAYNTGLHAVRSMVYMPALCGSPAGWARTTAWQMAACKNRTHRSHATLLVTLRHAGEAWCWLQRQVRSLPSCCKTWASSGLCLSCKHCCLMHDALLAPVLLPHLPPKTRCWCAQRHARLCNIPESARLLPTKGGRSTAKVCPHGVCLNNVYTMQQSRSHGHMRQVQNILQPTQRLSMLPTNSTDPETQRNEWLRQRLPMHKPSANVREHDQVHAPMLQLCSCPELPHTRLKPCRL
jgi:hypothetical protein